MSKIKRLFCLVSAFMLSVSILSIVVSASEYAFYNNYIYGNKYITMRTDKVNTDNRIYINISEIYKADGSSSNYSQVKIGLFNGATQVLGDTAITKGKSYGYAVDKKYQTTSISLNIKGNNSSLDAKISGKSWGWK